MAEGEVDDEMRREMNTLVAAYVLDALPADERTAFEAYLQTTPETEYEVRELVATAAVLGGIDAAPAPDALRARVLTAASATRQLPPLVRTATAGSAVDGPGAGRHTAPVPVADETARAETSQPETSTGATVVPLDAARRRRRRTLTGVGGGLAAAAVVVLAVVVGVQQHRLGEVRDSAAAASSTARQAQDQLSTYQSIASQPDARTAVAQVSSGGRATVLVSSDAGRGVVSFSSVSRLPAGKTYELWLVNGQTPRAVTTFGNDPSGNSVDFAGIRAGDALAVSVENRGGSTTGAPTTTPLFALPLSA